MPIFPQGGPRAARKRVSQDWFASLPGEKSQLFNSIVQQWECSHAMMAVALRDPLTLRTRGEIVCAREQVVMASDLLSRLADILISACSTIAEYGRQNLSAPAVEPLKTSCFRGNTAKDAASWNNLLHFVIFGSRSDFLHKVKIISGAIDSVSREFDQAVEEFTAYSLPTDEAWEVVDSLHSDLSTCLRELEVVFKLLPSRLAREPRSGSGSGTAPHSAASSQTFARPRCVPSRAGASFQRLIPQVNGDIRWL